VNESRTLIVSLSQPVAAIARNIEDNIKVLEEHKNIIESNSHVVDGLKNTLYMPSIDLELKYYGNPRTVCTGPQCGKLYKVGQTSLNMIIRTFFTIRVI
jgi:hypothetical protein